ncbi:AAA family ATPase [Parapedobacter indicus]|uniref:AAA domain-containing protein n=1 Tax=Parapedobacter indicus TaxID=1477437 RepID=A0A1I3E091_9SPHI|nr:AAA family ATPase [Parapedobacter indicus]PPL04915.1 AAA domain-containing protein [Parapedobacter indicus]SFH92365.1 AAA domain-containing protein [Parapedobacter indicus]
MNIIIKSLTIINFKGISKLTIPFQQVTSILGANASGKTTVFDAFLFLLFGKDSTDRKDFEIKPLDGKGNAKQRTENEVSAILIVDGEEISLRHLMKEKWVKKRGEETAEFTGNEHLYFWNDVPMQAGEYAARINDILPENVFKLLTNPLYFNSIKWQDRRAILQEIAGEVTDEELIGINPDFAKLLESLSGKTLKELRAMNAVEKKRLKEELAMIPPRIDELERSKPELVDETEIQAEIDTLQAQYDAIEKQIEDRNEVQKTENEAIRELTQRKHTLETLNQGIRAKVTQEYNSDVIKSGSAEKELSDKISRQYTALAEIESTANRQKSQLSSLDSSHNDRIRRISRDREEINGRIASLRTQFETVNAKEIDPNSLVCSECGREHEAHNMNDIIAKFNENKMNELRSIKERGDALKADMNRLNEELTRAETEVSTTKEAINKTLTDLQSQHETEQAALNDLQAQLEAVKSNKVVVTPVADRLAEHADFNANIKDIEGIDEALRNRPGIDLSDLRTKKAIINADLDAAKRKLLIKDRITAADNRINELKAQEKTMAQELAAIERQEFVAESYEKAKSEELERRVNGMFKYANFKLFNHLINGGEEPTCVTTYQGVPFPDLNNAAKILVGIDIINTLSAHHGVTAPVFLDNRESVSNIPDTAAQVINLIVSPADEKLRVA